MAQRLPVVSVQLAAPVTSVGRSGSGRVAQDRLDVDITASKPNVIHVDVALSDNVDQGIAPVPRALGDGQDPQTNLLWGAWVSHEVSDAWDGVRIREALRTYSRMTAVGSPETVEVHRESDSPDLDAAVVAHLLAFVGHTGRMDFSLESPEGVAIDRPARSAIVLACASKPCFLGCPRPTNAHPLLLTTGLMVHEVYIPDSAIRAWVGKQATPAMVDTATTAHDRYQQCGISTARPLFWGEPSYTAGADHPRA